MADSASVTNLPATGAVSRRVSPVDEFPGDALPAELAAKAGGTPAPGSASTRQAPDSPTPAKLPIAKPSSGKSSTGRPSTEKPASPSRARRGGRVFSAVCALLSLAGATVALTAPTLRPQAFDLARAWLGDASPVLRYLAPPAADTGQAAAAAAVATPAGLTYPTPAFQAPASASGDTSLQAAALAAVRAEMIATLRLELDGVRRTAAEQAVRVAAVSASVKAAQSDAVSARSEAHAAAVAADGLVRAQDVAAHAQEASSRALNGATERLDRLEAQMAGSDARVRATGMVVAAGELRRDIIAGAPLHDDLSALTSNAPLPAAVQQALDQLSRSEGGVPTLRDLGIGFEAVDAAIVARGGGQASWLSLSGWFGGGMVHRDTLDRLRALAAEGRFVEVADILERTEWADLAQRWATRVRQRSTAVMAGQTILANALAAYEASQTTPPALPQAGPAPGPRRPLP